MKRASEQLERLQAIMARLRSENGCPWDRAQDLRSMRPFLLEEAYEVLEQMDAACEGGPGRALCEELGDLVFQVVFQARLAEEAGRFELADVLQAIGDKLEFRHPHVFGGAPAASGATEVLTRWAALKAEERRRKTGSAGSALQGVPREAPALLRAERLTEKAARVGFDWPRREDVRAKLDEELRELDEAIASGDRVAIEHELGDVLFSLSNLARWLHCPGEDALRGALSRFTARFHYIEQQLALRGRTPSQSSLEEMDALWNEAKQRLERD